MTRLQIIPAVFLIVLSALATRTAEAGSSELSNTFAAMLEENIKAADLVAHVEVTELRAENRNGDYVRYRISARTVKQFKGPRIDKPVFYWWVDHELKDDDMGEGIIVTLLKNPQDQQYYIPDNGYSFPASARLLGVAEGAVRSD